MKPIIILVAPQMGENIGSVARAMKNFAFDELRLVKPRDGWPNDKATALAAGAVDILDNIQIYESIPAATSDLTYLYATSACKRDLNIETIEIGQLIQNNDTNYGNRVGVMFGRENNGLTNEELSFANKIIYISTNPNFSSLNIAQAVLLVCYKFFNINIQPNTGANFLKNSLATKVQVENFLYRLYENLNNKNFFQNSRNTKHMMNSIRNIFNKIEDISAKEVQILEGIVKSLSKTIK